MFDAAADAFPPSALRPLGAVRPGEAGVVRRVAGAGDLERRLLEIGVVEGARVQVLHEGLFGRDPIAVRVDDTRIALRRRECAEVMVALDASPPR